MLTDKVNLRKQLKSARLTLSPQARACAEKQIAARLEESEMWGGAKKIASYMAIKGEVNLDLLHVSAWRQHKELFLPVLEHEDLLFIHYTADSLLKLNRYHIQEPPISESSKINIAELDLLLIPLVGFDKNKHRLGMGMGYYDKALASLLTQNKRPFLMGVAFACQEVDVLPTDQWDIALDCIVTEKEIK